MSNAKALWIAKTVLRRGATVRCPHCLDVDDEAVPISEPCEYVPREIVIPREGGKTICVELAVLPKAHRYCERCGTVNFGSPLADREFEAFQAVLEELCDSARFVDYPQRRLQKERSDALAKNGREEGPHDVTIVRSFVDSLITSHGLMATAPTTPVQQGTIRRRRGRSDVHGDGDLRARHRHGRR
ncbi:hypothetical protein [Halolamina sp.]|uniref:hypothetical protein n=1 Tax=Halolamina sp. TaxID=1940283 RepID=UPI000223BBC0|nr:hypothetical protein Halar_2367 [halophilic archaeon DL31]